MNAEEFQPEWQWTETTSLVGHGQADFPSAACGNNNLSCNVEFHATQPLCDDNGVLLMMQPPNKAPKTGSCSVKLCMHQAPPFQSTRDAQLG
jgi:hypothetical protein